MSSLVEIGSVVLENFRILKDENVKKNLTDGRRGDTTHLKKLRTFLSKCVKFGTTLTHFEK